MDEIGTIRDIDDGRNSCTQQDNRLGKAFIPSVANETQYHFPTKLVWIHPTSEGDQRHLYGQGKPQAKNSSGAGANWYLGEQSVDGTGLGEPAVLYSRTMFNGTVTATDMDRATDSREKGRIGIFGTGNAYAGSSGRVTSERIGRDLNPLGRGDGSAYVGGAMNYGTIAPRLPKNSSPGGWGNTVNNGCCDGPPMDFTPNGPPTEPPQNPPNGSIPNYCPCCPVASCKPIFYWGHDKYDTECCPSECAPWCGTQSSCSKAIQQSCAEELEKCRTGYYGFSTDGTYKGCQSGTPWSNCNEALPTPCNPQKGAGSCNYPMPTAYALCMACNVKGGNPALPCADAMASCVLDCVMTVCKLTNSGICQKEIQAVAKDPSNIANIEALRKCVAGISKTCRWDKISVCIGCCISHYGKCGMYVHGCQCGHSLAGGDEEWSSWSCSNRKCPE